ncbi:MAG: hypothetical protein V4737_03115 [Curtobacterium sp.]
MKKFWLPQTIVKRSLPPAVGQARQNMVDYDGLTVEPEGSGFRIRG